ncbi:VOC family protein [Pseudohaliea sp.]|uniref:VOC family protein n=1 Tax=Pseudohaliea sp. TaxID=2740289 RepID=UPI0032F07776
MSAAGYPERPLPWFQRACLLVRALEPAFEVYRDLLGFEVAHVGEDGPDAYSYEIFRLPRDVSTRFATLSSAAQLRTLALIEVPGEVLRAPSIPAAATVIQVDSVAATLERARGLGLACCEPRHHPAPPNGPARSEAAFYDHDGHPVVIYALLEPGS